MGAVAGLSAHDEGVTLTVLPDRVHRGLVLD